MYICTCNSITKHVYFPRGIVAWYPEIIGHSLRVITVRGKTNQRREGGVFTVSKLYYSSEVCLRHLLVRRNKEPSK